MKHTNQIIVRVPTDIKKKFKEVCNADLLDMSTKIRQFILQEIRK